MLLRGFVVSLLAVAATTASGAAVPPPLAPPPCASERGCMNNKGGGATIKSSTCSHPHCPLASFKRPDRPLQHVRNLARDVKERLGRLLARIERQRSRRNYALDVWEAEMALRQQILRQWQEETAAAAVAGGNGKSGPQTRGTGGAGGSTGGKGGASSLPASLVHHKPPSSPEPVVVFVSDGSIERGSKQQPVGAVRKYLTYGHWVLDVGAFAVKAIAVVLFQVMGAAMALHEYQKSGVVSTTLLSFGGLLFGLAFVPPMVVALREALPSSSRNPLVRGVSRIFEMAFDVLIVSALSLVFSIVVTAVLALPSYQALLSHKLTEDYIRGAVAAGLVYFGIWAFSRNFEPLASKWFM